MTTSDKDLRFYMYAAGGDLSLDNVHASVSSDGFSDYKTAMNNMCQRLKLIKPEYSIQKLCDGWGATVNYTIGMAGSDVPEENRNEAMQRAAYEAFRILGYIPDDEPFEGLEDRSKRTELRRQSKKESDVTLKAQLFGSKSSLGILPEEGPKTFKEKVVNCPNEHKLVQVNFELEWCCNGEYCKRKELKELGFWASIAKFGCKICKFILCDACYGDRVLNDVTSQGQDFWIPNAKVFEPPVKKKRKRKIDSQTGSDTSTKKPAPAAAAEVINLDSPGHQTLPAFSDDTIDFTKEQTSDLADAVRKDIADAVSFEVVDDDDEDESASEDELEEEFDIFEVVSDDSETENEVAAKRAAEKAQVEAEAVLQERKKRMSPLYAYTLCNSWLLEDMEREEIDDRIPSHPLNWFARAERENVGHLDLTFQHCVYATTIRSVWLVDDMEEYPTEYHHDLYTNGLTTREEEDVVAESSALPGEVTEDASDDSDVEVIDYRIQSFSLPEEEDEEVVEDFRLASSNLDGAVVANDAIEISDDDTKKKEVFFMCKIEDCSGIFATQLAWLKHTAQIHADVAIAYICCFCSDIALTSRKSLLWHMKTRHEHMLEKFQMSRCQIVTMPSECRPLADTSHDNEPLYPCLQKACKQQFDSMQVLEGHCLTMHCKYLCGTMTVGQEFCHSRIGQAAVEAVDMSAERQEASSMGPHPSTSSRDLSDPFLASVNNIMDNLQPPPSLLDVPMHQGNPHQGNPHQGNPHQGNPRQGNPLADDLLANALAANSALVNALNPLHGNPLINALSDFSMPRVQDERDRVQDYREDYRDRNFEDNDYRRDDYHDDYRAPPPPQDRYRTSTTTAATAPPPQDRYRRWGPEDY